MKAICVQNWDTNGDGELSEAEAAAVTTLGEVFKDNRNITLFNEFQYFTGLTSIGDYAFYGCSELISLVIPNSVTYIGYLAFNGCNNLPFITIPKSVSDIDDYAFNGGFSINVENSTPFAITSKAFSWRQWCTLHVPAGSKAAYQAADYWKEFMEIVEVGSNNQPIAFADAKVKSLCLINWDFNHDDNLSYAEAAAVTSYEWSHSFWRFNSNTEITSFNELQYFTGLTEIEDECGSCTSLTSITIPNSVKSKGVVCRY